jgi:hypothetical protein
MTQLQHSSKAEVGEDKDEQTTGKNRTS